MEDNLVMTSLEDSDVDNVNLKTDTSDDKWVVVKSKNAVHAKSELVVVETPILAAAPQVVKQQGARSLSDIADSWDTFEVDEEKEREKEKRRLKKKKQRAAKCQRDKENKRAKTEALSSESPSSSSSMSAELVENELELVDTAESDSRVKATVSNVLNTIIQDAVAKFQLEQADEKAQLERAAAESAPIDPYITGKYNDGDIIREEEEDERNRKAEGKETLFIDAKKHAKLAFRILWFDNKKKLEKLRISDKQQKDLQDRINNVRIMRDRIDMAGRFVYYRTAHPRITSVMEENVINIASNLIDQERQAMSTDMEMATGMRAIVGNMTKKFTYENYVFSILCLMDDFIPKLKKRDQIIAYKHMVILLRLFMKRVDKLYDDLCDLYEFNVVKVPKKRNRRH